MELRGKSEPMGNGQPIGHQQDEKSGHQGSFGGIDLGLQKEVRNCEDCQSINNSMQLFPAASHAANSGVKGRGAENGKAGESYKTDDKIDPMGNFAKYVAEMKALIRHVDAEMKQSIGKGGKADHPTHDNQAGPIVSALQGCDQERYKQKPDRPFAGLGDSRIKRQWTQRTGDETGSDPHSRYESCT